MKTSWNLNGNGYWKPIDNNQLVFLSFKKTSYGGIPKDKLFSDVQNNTYISWKCGLRTVFSTVERIEKSTIIILQSHNIFSIYIVQIISWGWI